MQDALGPSFNVREQVIRPSNPPPPAAVSFAFGGARGVASVMLRLMRDNLVPCVKMATPPSEAIQGVIGRYNVWARFFRASCEGILPCGVGGRPSSPSCSPWAVHAVHE